MTVSHAAITEPTIVARHLRRIYTPRQGWFGPRKQITAVDDVGFEVPAGTIFGLLGPNGAGKTTTIKMLSTLLLPTGGTATVGGHDVVHAERLVRRQLGVVLGGERGLYNKLSARDNLRYFGTLYAMTDDAIARRTEELLALVKLRERAGERVEGYSRGMKQRLHLAKALLHDPPILILDEPTIGLDPAAAVDLRRAIADLVPRHTVLLTTHDMHEADGLCREIAIIDRGLIVAQGTPMELKARVAAERRIVIVAAPAGDCLTTIDAALSTLPGVHAVQHERGAEGVAWTLRCEETGAALDRALAVLRRHEAPVRGVRVVEPSLEDVFLAVTGRELR
jgi:ABC-2 type transport system ATP-binding protein